MATVRISQGLNDQVIQKLRSDTANRRQHLINRLVAPMSHEKLIALAFDSFLQKAGIADIYDRIPQSWLNSISTLDIASINGVDATHFRRISFATRYVPTHFLTHGSSWTRPLPLSGPEFAEYAEILSGVNTAIKDFDDAATKTQTQVQTLLNNCTTLRQALEYWGGLIDLLPKDVIDKHNDKTERVKIEPAKLSLDTEHLNTAIVLNKISAVT